jgi:hypothetical protein
MEKKDDKEVGYYLLILLIIIIILLLLTKYKFQFSYDMSSPYLDEIIDNVLAWDLDFKYFFRSTNSDDIYHKNLNTSDKLFDDSFNT